MIKEHIVPFITMIYLEFTHRGLNRFHRGHTAYIPYILTIVYKVYRPRDLYESDSVYRVYRPRDLYESDSSQYIRYIGRVTSMKAIQAPVNLLIFFVVMCVVFFLFKAQKNVIIIHR